MYESNRESLTKTKSVAVPVNFENSRSLEKAVDPYSEIADIFPALKKYKDEHNTSNLQKLCVEVLEFCRSIYASTQNENEREAFRKIVRKLSEI
jgi:hypothetical protein